MLDMATITIDQETYTLRFTLGSLARAEALIGKSLEKMFMPTKDAQGNSVFPDVALSDIVTLFKLGISVDYPKITDAKAEKLIEDFLSDGQSVAHQKYILYLILGKAAGFFRTETDFQAEAENLSKKSPKK